MSADDGSSEGAEVGSSDRSAETTSVAASDPTERIREFLRRFWTAREGPLMVLRETLVSLAVVAAVGLVLFAASGVWPPMVAVESGSMEPHMSRGDLVFISETGRYVPDGGATAGVVTRETAQEIDYRTFGGHGSVVVYDDPAEAGPPVIHRAHFWVEAGENWYDSADPGAVDANGCEQMPNCPAPHAGLITKGDANEEYDQVNGISPRGPVRADWLVGIAHVRVPYLGYVRLWLSESLRPGPQVLVTGEAAPVDGEGSSSHDRSGVARVHTSDVVRVHASGVARASASTAWTERAMTGSRIEHPERAGERTRSRAPSLHGRATRTAYRAAT